MGYFEGMQRLADDIKTSYGARVASLHNCLHGFREPIKAEVGGIKKETKAMLTDFHKSHEGIAEELREGLETFKEELTDNVQKMRNEAQKMRRPWINELKRTHEMFRKFFSEMAKIRSGRMPVKSEERPKAFKMPKKAKSMAR